MNIGLTQRVFVHNGQSYDATDRDWYKFFSDEELVLIRNNPSQDFDAMADNLDVLVISGGNDPIERHLTEIRLAKCMLSRQKPIIGVCHGAFLLTELMQGKIGEIEAHHNVEHIISTVDGKKVVNSFHNLSIEQAPATATILATDDHGNIESWIDGTIAAIVWHPERMSNSYIPTPILALLNLKDK